MSRQVLTPRSPARTDQRPDQRRELRRLAGGEPLPADRSPAPCTCGQEGPPMLVGDGIAVRLPEVPGRGAAAVGPEARDPAELRCGCGSLMARMVGGELELKCRRCKRAWRIPVAVD